MRCLSTHTGSGLPTHTCHFQALRDFLLRHLSPQGLRSDDTVLALWRDRDLRQVCLDTVHEKNKERMTRWLDDQRTDQTCIHRGVRLTSSDDR